MYLPSEWHQHEFTQLTWPHSGTDWAPVLADAIDCFCNIAREVIKREPLLIVAQYPNEVKEELSKRGIDFENITIVKTNTNDTWARDHAFITTVDSKKKCIYLNDFQFNGWGLKFASNYDNQINWDILPYVAEKYSKKNINSEYINKLDFVFEGGSIESDGEGTLMVTSSCLLSDNRNNTLSQEDIEEKLKSYFNADRVIWIEHSWLAGDDTDGHIDTVARFCSKDKIAYVKCYDENDEHYEELLAMEEELKTLRTKDNKPYQLFPLPLPDACFDDEGNRLPATHANFYILNGAVLVPTYNQPEKDAEALSQIKKAFPGRVIKGIDCRVLIIQHGSLHCSTMQYPQI